MSLAILSGFLVGLAFGFVLQRGYFCQFSGFIDAIMFRNFKILKGTIWAILVAMIGFHLLASLGYLNLNPKPLFWGANIVGGIIFGIGMFLVGGCIAGTTFKIGNGLIGYLIAGLGIAFGGLMALEGFLKPWREFLQSSTKIGALTLASVLKVNPWLVVIFLSLVFLWLLWKLREKEEIKEKVSLKEKILRKTWSPCLTGISIGLIGMVAFLTSAASGRNYPLGIVGGYILILKSLLTGNFQVINWIYLLIPGIILGSAISAILASEFRIRLLKPKEAIKMFFGGFLIGGGAVIGGGCNVIHVLSGIPQLSLGSILSTISFFGTVYLITRFKFLKS